MADTLKSSQANADLEAMKANMDQFFLIVNGSIIILMQVCRTLASKVVHNIPYRQGLHFSKLGLSGAKT